MMATGGSDGHPILPGPLCAEEGGGVRGAAYTQVRSKTNEAFLDSGSMILICEPRERSLDHRVCSLQHRGCDREAKSLGRLEIDHQLELRDLFDW